MIELGDYFKSPQYQNALDSYERVAKKRRWYIEDKLMMYRWAKTAFEEQVVEQEKILAFTEIYEQLRKYWQVFRNARGEYWSAKKIFEVFISDCRSCSRESELSLLTIKPRSTESQEVLNVLRGLANLKPSADYPWMAVSKFTHFFNPKIFPIYDQTVIWNLVLNGVFRDDYRRWCARNYLNPLGPGAKFNLHYMLWAGHSIRNADDDFMKYFTEWFISQVGSGEGKNYFLDDLHQYYATAFEFVAIGATELLG